MKNIFLLVLLFSCQIFVAQTQTNDYKITYKQFISYGDKLKRDAILYVKENQPTFMHRIMASTMVLEEQIPTELPKSTNNDAVVIKGGSGTGKPFDYRVFPDHYLMVDQKKKLNIAIDYIGTKRSFLITDDLLNYTWEITSETKKIKEYTCYKATTTFRGNKYEAWFTPDIPLNVGPWKWYGLPGLIVEAYDVEKKEIYLLEKIEKLMEDIPFPKDKLKSISLKDYIIEKEEFFGNPLGGSLDRNTTVTTDYKRSGLEKIFEWEEK